MAWRRSPPPLERSDPNPALPVADMASPETETESLSTAAPHRITLASTVHARSTLPNTTAARRHRHSGLYIGPAHRRKLRRACAAALGASPSLPPVPRLATSRAILLRRLAIHVRPRCRHPCPVVLLLGPLPEARCRHAATCADNGCNGRFVIGYHGGGNITMSTPASTCRGSVVGVRPAAK